MALTKIGTDGVKDDAVTTDKLANAINTERTANTAKVSLGADSVTGAKIADNAIDSEHYTDGSIDTAHIADNQITLAKMAGGTDGQIITYDASGDPIAVGPGTDGQVLTSTGAGSPPAFESAGKILQVVQTYRTSQFSESVAQGDYSAAVMTASITPASSSNKILVLCTVHISTGSGTNGAQARLARDGTAIGIADADGSRTRATGAGMGSSAVNRMQSNVQMTFLDSPSSTSALSYTAHIKPGYAGTQTVYLNREGGGHSTDASNVGLSASNLTLMEVAA